ncbi:MAG: cytochrome c oxidase subunit II [Melioribacteraceae bacterium]|nr:cytochrome c oxidase subunit II [Melioribacteraceae bacterium]MDD3558658.1 cytochrome c oxidase subunit II [Melioribacteraceae bacterium]
MLQTTNYVETVDSVMIYIVAISVFLLLGITAVMIYFVFKYNRKKGHKPVDIHGSVALETIWIVIPTILVLSMFYFGYQGFKEGKYIPEDALRLSGVGRMWEWEFKYDGFSTKELYVPVNKPILLELESADVNHALWIPALRVKTDVIAGKLNYLVFTANEVGEYEIACAEYCGLNHSQMYSKVIAMEESEYENWLKKKTSQKEPVQVEKNNMKSDSTEVQL